MVVSFENHPVAEGGGCSRPGDDCYNWPGKAVALSDEWETVELPFCELRPEIGWGGDVAPLDPTELVGLQFRLPAGPDIDLWMDDLEFFTAEEGEGSVSCCPMDLAPYPENIAPNRSELDLTAELTPHTFEQETPRCGSITRRYLSFVPADLPAESDAPVIIALHGSAASAETFQSLYARGRLDALAARDGFIVVYGNAAPGEHGDLPDVLNSGAWRQDIYDDGEVDDVAYLERVVEDLRERSVISGDNDLYLIGLSNGGGMAIKAATERPELFRGIAPFMAFAGFSPPPPPDLTRTGLTRVFFAYSRTDPGLSEEYLDIQADVPVAWAEALGLPAEVIETPAETPIPNAVFEGEDYNGDATAARNTRNSAATQLDMIAPDGLRKVRILVFDHAGHLWPSPVGDNDEYIVGDLGFRNQDLDAADAIWEFFGETDHSR